MYYLYNFMTQIGMCQKPVCLQIQIYKAWLFCVVFLFFMELCLNLFDGQNLNTQKVQPPRTGVYALTSLCSLKKITFF